MKSSANLFIRAPVFRTLCKIGSLFTPSEPKSRRPCARLRMSLSVLTGCIILVAAAFWLPGCGIHGQGQTAAEGRIRHQRTVEISTQQLADDLDSALLLDKPSKLSKLRVR